jgi:hypothetical protein
MRRIGGAASGWADLAEEMIGTVSPRRQLKIAKIWIDRTASDGNGPSQCFRVLSPEIGGQN